MKLIAGILIFCSLLLAQENRTIVVTGEQLIGREENGMSVREVIGNVVLTQGNVRITCQRAIQYIASNNARLIGNVVVRQDTLTIYTPEGFYYGNERRAFSDKTVRLEDRKMTLTAVTGEYKFNEAIADFRTSVNLKDPATNMNADRLIYYRKDNKASAYGSVVIKDSANTIYADSLTHLRMEQITYAYSNVMLQSKSGSDLVFGNYLEDFRKKKYSKIEDNPLYVRIDSAKNDSTKKFDTLYVTGMVFEAFRDSSNKFIVSDSVKLNQNSLSAVATRMTLFNNDNTILLEKVGKNPINPVVWYDNSELSGDTVKVFIKESRLEEVTANGNSLILSENKKFTGRIDQISGNNSGLKFLNGKLTLAESRGNVLSYYFSYEDEKPNGVIKASAKSLKMRFQDNLVAEVRLYGEPASEFHPEKEVRGNEKSYFLPKFKRYSGKPEKKLFIKLFSDRTGSVKRKK